MARLRIPSALLLGALMSSAAAADDEPLVSDRRGATESAATVTRGRTQIDHHLPGLQDMIFFLYFQ